MKVNELLKLIDKEKDGDGVRCLLEGIYGENKGAKMFNAWMKWDVERFKRLVEREEA